MKFNKFLRKFYILYLRKSILNYFNIQYYAKINTIFDKRSYYLL